MGRKKKIKTPKVLETEVKKVEEAIVEEEETVTDQLLENPELMLSKTEDFFSKNKTMLYAIVGVICVVAIGIIGYRYYKTSQQEEALLEMYPAEFFFAADSVNIMLNGNGNYMGMNEIADNYGMSDASKVANLYAGVGLMKNGKFEEAISKLNKFSSSDAIIQGKAYCLTGDAHLELKQFDKATTYYNKAIQYKPNQYFTPTYLMKLGLVYELKKEWSKAADTYDKIISKYPRSQVVNDAKKYKAKAEATIAK